MDGSSGNRANGPPNGAAGRRPWPVRLPRTANGSREATVFRTGFPQVRRVAAGVFTEAGRPAVRSA
ncbi:hypothetical protein A4V12_18500 [Streptomyces noursei]|nr:hypothetical protein A4V12_18500 [Streptomyces noursei]